MFIHLKKIKQRFGRSSASTATQIDSCGKVCVAGFMWRGHSCPRNLTTSNNLGFELGLQRWFEIWIWNSLRASCHPLHAFRGQECPRPTIVLLTQCTKQSPDVRPRENELARFFAIGKMRASSKEYDEIAIPDGTSTGADA
jgi:hypothetical protein